MLKIKDLKQLYGDTKPPFSLTYSFSQQMFLACRATCQFQLPIVISQLVIKNNNNSNKKKTTTTTSPTGCSTYSRLLDSMFATPSGDTLNINIYLETNGSQMCPCPCLKRNDFHHFFDQRGYNNIRCLSDFVLTKQ